MELGESGAATQPEQISYHADVKASVHAYPDGPRSATGLFAAARGGLIAYIVAELALLSLVGLYSFAPQLLPDIFFSQSINDLNAGYYFDWVYLVVCFVAFVLVCRFTYRTMRNLHTIGSPTAEMSPGWTVGWYFVPFANLWQPAMGMSQVYHGTHEAVGEKSRASSPIPLWWTCWLLASVPNSIAQYVAVEPLLYFLLMGASSLLGICAAITLMRFMHRITERQELLKHGGVAHVFE